MPQQAVHLSGRQIEDMIRRIYNQNKDIFEELGFHTWKEWLNQSDPDEIAETILSDYTLYELYIRHLPQDTDLTDIIINYKQGLIPYDLPASSFVYERGHIEPSNIENRPFPWQPQNKQNLTPENAKDIYQTAIQRITNTNKTLVTQARKDLYLAFNTDPELATMIGIKDSELKKRIRTYSGLKAKDKQLEDRLNHGIPEEHQWIGISNSTFIGQQKISHDDLEQFVREIDVTEKAGQSYFKDSGDRLRQYVANVFMAIDTRISYEDLGLKIGSFEKRTTRGKFDPVTNTVIISDINQNTIAHEIGHYLDHKWGNEFGAYGPLSQFRLPFQKPQREWAKKFQSFLKQLMFQSDISSSYSQSPSEVFARFIDQFVTWASRHPVASYSSSYFDQFKEQDFQTFVYLLQEKSFLDAKYPIPKTASFTQIKTADVETDDPYAKREVFIVHDVDRYLSDDYAVNVSYQQSINRISLGLYVTNQKLGISGYQEYWHYHLNEKKQADKTYANILDIVQSTVQEIGYDQIPHTLVKPFLRYRLNEVDTQHKERSGIYHYNWYSTEAEKTEDWRSSIYGRKYPHYDPEPLQTEWNIDESSRNIETQGTARNKVTRYKYTPSIKMAQSASTTHQHSLYSRTNWYNVANTLKCSTQDLPSQPILLRATTLLNKSLDKYLALNNIEILEDNIWMPITQSQKGNSMSEWLKTHRNARISPILAFAIMGYAINTSLAEPKIASMKKQSRGIRNNNPGNIVKNSIQWNGMSKKQSDNRFVIFEYPQDGIRAMARVLRKYQNKHHLRTIDQIIDRWSQSNSNYAQYVAKRMNCSSHDPIDCNDDNKLLQMIIAMITYENGYQPYNSQIIREAIRSERTNKRPWSKSMPTPLNQPQRRIKKPPQSFIRPFDTKQVEVFDKKTAQHTEQYTDKDRAIQFLYRAISDAGKLEWPIISSILVRKYKIPKDLIRYLYDQFIGTMASLANNHSRWRHKFATHNTIK